MISDQSLLLSTIVLNDMCHSSSVFLMIYHLLVTLYIKLEETNSGMGRNAIPITTTMPTYSINLSLCVHVNQYKIH